MSKFPQQPAQGVVQAQAVPVLVGQQPGQTVVMNNGVAAPGNVNIVMSPGMQQQPGQQYTVTVVQNQRQVEDTSGRDTQLIIMLVGCFCFPPIFLMGKLPQNACMLSFNGSASRRFSNKQISNFSCPLHICSHVISHYVTLRHITSRHVTHRLLQNE